MSSEKQIDDYINELEEKNVVYVDKELEYAEKCHSLEEEIGCPLEVLFKALKNGVWWKNKKGEIINLVSTPDHPIIYDWNENYPILQYMEVSEDMIYTTSCIYDMFISDYKKTWWLREDKSE